MIVKELRDHLSNLNDDLEVYIYISAEEHLHCEDNDSNAIVNITQTLPLNSFLLKDDFAIISNKQENKILLSTDDFQKQIYPV
ncbi:MAG: hypothetical protein FWD38_11640 [Oscillospiraceae bacterium]|nr:hypothetical protein [Oscillospiraceae bacterium]